MAQNGSRNSDDKSCGVCLRKLLAMKFDCSMSTVAEGLVFGLTTAAQCHAVTLFVFLAVGRNQRDFPAQPERTTTRLRGIFYQTDRRQKFRLQGSPTVLVPYYQTSSRTVLNLSNKRGAHVRIVSAGNLVPYLAIRVAETSERAQACDIQESERRAVIQLRLIH
jgi:hypothetical protein